MIIWISYCFQIWNYFFHFILSCSLKKLDWMKAYLKMTVTWGFLPIVYQLKAMIKLAKNTKEMIHHFISKLSKHSVWKRLIWVHFFFFSWAIFILIIFLFSSFWPKKIYFYTWRPKLHFPWFSLNLKILCESQIAGVVSDCKCERKLSKLSIFLKVAKTGGNRR